MLVYTRPEEEAPDSEPYEAYLERIRSTDFRRSPDLPRYFVLDFFNDGAFERFDYEPHENTLVLEMESVYALNDVYDLRARHGLPRVMPHRCEDFRYVCTFRDVAYLQVRRKPMQIEKAETGETTEIIPRGRFPDDYQYGRILNSSLCRELETQAGIPLFHLHFVTGWAKQVDVIFGKVSVRKSNTVKYESYTGGKRVKLSHVFRG